MTVIALANPKGGVGKSVLATNLAAMFAAHQYRVTLYDADPQRSGGKWCELRASLGVRPYVSMVRQEGDMYDQLTAVAADTDITIVDVSGTRGGALTIALGLADIALVPVVPSQFEVWALDDAAKVFAGLKAKGATFKAYALLNNAPYHAQSRDVKSTRAALNAYKAYFTPCETTVVGRQVFKDALCCGLSVVEMDGGNRDVKATENLNQVYEDIFHAYEN
jgi:chromosome partitioning protein